jgi:hypothetical protein
MWNTAAAHLAHIPAERKSMVRSVMFAAASAALGLAPIAGAKAAELKVLAGGSMTDSLHEIGPQFERAAGHKLVHENRRDCCSPAERPCE